eukprot:SAG31_NODE_105_length_25008_cov_17.439399_2_plen_115_part_00
MAAAQRTNLSACDLDAIQLLSFLIYLHQNIVLLNEKISPWLCQKYRPDNCGTRVPKFRYSYLLYGRISESNIKHRKYVHYRGTVLLILLLNLNLVGTAVLEYLTNVLDILIFDS